MWNCGCTKYNEPSTKSYSIVPYAIISQIHAYMLTYRRYKSLMYYICIDVPYDDKIIYHRTCGRSMIRHSLIHSEFVMG